MKFLETNCVEVLKMFRKALFEMAAEDADSNKEYDLNAEKTEVSYSLTRPNLKRYSILLHVLHGDPYAFYPYVCIIYSI